MVVIFYVKFLLKSYFQFCVVTAMKLTCRIHIDSLSTVNIGEVFFNRKR